MQVTGLTIEQVTAWFMAQNFPAIEAGKFFHYYNAKGWRIGQHPIQDWQAAARNWILKIPQFSAAVPGAFRSTALKDYAEPL